MNRTNLYSIIIASMLGLIVGVGSTYALIRHNSYISASEIVVRKSSGDLGYFQGMLKRRTSSSNPNSNAEFLYLPQLEIMAVNSWLIYAASAKSLHEKGINLPPGSMSPAKVAEFPSFVEEFKFLNDNRINFKPACKRYEGYFGVEIESSETLMQWFMENHKKIKQSPTLTDP